MAAGTLYDTEGALASWRKIAAYWAGGDDYATRVASLTSATGVPLLDASVVMGNGGGNSFVGDGEIALFYTDGLDNTHDFDDQSREITISP